MIRKAFSREGAKVAALGLFVPAIVFGVSPMAHAADPQTKVTPTMASQTSANLNTAHTGDTVTDTATVTGINGIAPTGVVQFNLFAGGNCNPNALLQTDTVAFSSMTNGVSTASKAFPAPALQASSTPYSAQAVYSGDGNYNFGIGSCDVINVFPANATINTAPTSTPPATS